MIVLSGISMSLGGRTVLHDINCRIEPGEFVCITGPSGAGKSTLLHLLSGAHAPTKGKIEVDGIDLSKIPTKALQLYRRRMGIVFQDYKLIQNQTVAENIGFPLDVCGVPRPAITKRVNELLQQLRIDQHRNALPHSLSGGEQARTAIARALVHYPFIVLADEPTGNVDPQEAMHILQLFKDIHSSGATVILATHNADLVDKLQTRVIRLEQGRIVRDTVGGYNHGNKNKSQHVTPGKHEIFTKDDEKGGGGGKRKVPIVFIGSKD